MEWSFLKLSRFSFFSPLVCLTYAEVIMSVVGPIVALGLMIVLRAILRKAYIKRKRQIELAMETDKEQA